ncbi:MAG: Radical SAM domain protein [Berkelbacteria bacterium GW2011_GWA1_36_9]|uniref:Radical SAM domain protein n=1 Tax=Berkelbacteria bacterium GW2011_GWA1_36_9 TaxID=1618331 RepID=A0A0G0FEY5_9BACT|nr:MAG: Radical SAM domain protein [Berkelbacteria bacterium GW2011_GWA1_36_9]
MNILLVESNGIKVEDVNSGENVGPIRLFHPKGNLLAITSHLQHVLPEAKVRTLDMKDGEDTKSFKTIKYGDRKLQISFLGKTLRPLEEEVKDTDFLFVTSNFTCETNSVLRVLDHAKKTNSRLRTFIGGSDVMARPDFYKDYVDGVFVGEIESLSEEELRSFLFNSKGIIYAKDNVNMNSLKPDFIGLDISRFKESDEGPLPKWVRSPFLSLETSRGCKRACNFCTTAYLKGRYRYMNLETINKFLDFYKQRGVKSILMIEDNLLSRVQAQTEAEREEGVIEVLAIIDLLKKKGFVWEWANGLEIGLLWNPFKNEVDVRLTEALYSHYGSDEMMVGCVRGYTPLEKLYQNFMNKFKKLVSFDKEKEILKVIASTNVPLIHCGVIIGTPDETEDSIKITEERATEVKELFESSGQTQTYINVFASIPLPGTPDYNNFSKKGALRYSITDSPELWTFTTSVIQGRVFSPENMTRIRVELSDRINGPEAAKYWRKSGKYFTDSMH